ncbi:MAG: secretin and TonB N-terminal domain-containing protein [bacterium]
MMKRFAILAVVPLLLVSSALPSGSPFGDQRLSLELDGVAITTALQMIASQNGLNIVVAGEVDGTVSMRLDDVDLQSALEAILSPNGYNYYLNGNIIVVKPRAMDAAGELTSAIVTLKYQQAISVVNALEARLSDKGKAIVIDIPNNSGTYTPNQIMITDLPDIVDDLVSLAQSLDQPQRLISIGVKIIETKIDHQTKLGLDWPSQIAAIMGSSVTSSSGASGDDGTDATGGTNLAEFTGTYNPNSGSWTWGTLTVAQLTLVLDALNQNGNSKLISDPHITTLENHQAEIRAETIIPIPTVSRFTEGASTSDILTFQDEEVGISLLVTPRICEDGRLSLDVFPQIEDIIGFSGPSDNQKPITSSRSIRTRVTVRDGETVALGGLLKEDEIKQVSKVPLLGSIPLLGNLFTSKSTQKTTTDLLILITPKIMTD